MNITHWEQEIDDAARCYRTRNVIEKEEGIIFQENGVTADNVAAI